MKTTVTFGVRFANASSIFILVAALLIVMQSSPADVLRPASLLRTPGQASSGGLGPLGIYRGFDLDAITTFQQGIAPARIYWDIFRPFVGADFLDYLPATDELIVRIWWRAGQGAGTVYAPGEYRIPAKNTTLDIDLDSLADLRFLLSDVDRSAGPIGSSKWLEAMNGLLDPDGLYLGPSSKPNTHWKGLIHNFAYGSRASEISMMQGPQPYGTALDWRNSPIWVQSGYWLRSLAMHNLGGNTAFAETGVAAASYVAGLVQVVDKVPGAQACESKVPDSVYSANALLCVGTWMHRSIRRAVAAIANEDSVWPIGRHAFPMWPAVGAANFPARLEAASASLGDLYEPVVRQKMVSKFQGLAQFYAQEQASKFTPLSDMEWPTDPAFLQQFIDKKIPAIGAPPNTTPEIDFVAMQAAMQPIQNRMQQLIAKQTDFGLSESEQEEGQQLTKELAEISRSFLLETLSTVQPASTPASYEILPRAFYSIPESIEWSELAHIAMRIIRADPAYVAWGWNAAPGALRDDGTEQLVVELIRMSGPRWERDTILPNLQLADRRMMGDAALGLGLRQPVGSVTALQLEALQTLRHLANPDLNHPALRRAGLRAAVARGAEALHKSQDIQGQKSNPNFVRFLIAIGPDNSLLADQYLKRGINAVHGDNAWLATNYLMAIWYLGIEEGPGADIGEVISDFLFNEMGDEDTTIVSSRLRSLGALGGVISPQNPGDALAGFSGALDDGRAASKGDLSSFIEFIMTQTAVALESIAAADAENAEGG